MDASAHLPKTIKERFLLRRSRREDAERLGQFYTSVFKTEGGEPEMGFIPWVNDFLSGGHPTFGEGDFTIVEDMDSGEIVSAMNLISQTWTYGGMPIPVGRPEAVGTAEAYRSQGFVRAQFEVVHEWSRQRGELLQGITGIPYYYRLFGYEMCIDLGGGQIGYPGSLPVPSKEQLESYTIRPAAEEDLGFLAKLHQQACRRLLVACPRDEALWRYEIFGYSPGVDDARIIRIIESQAKQPLGYFYHGNHLESEGSDVNILACHGFELAPGASYLDVTPVVLDHLHRTGLEFASKEGKEYKGVGFFFEQKHPAMQAAATWLPRRKEPYAWYIRVPDLPAFLRRIAPVLEKRLEGSCCAGHSGELNVTFYTSKLSLGFEKGAITRIQQERFIGETGCQAAFPGLTFLHLLFGYRTLEEIEYIFPDCWADEGARQLLQALFPRQPSNIWPVS